MRVQEQFEIAESVPVVWSFFEQPQRVAECIPGIEDAVVHSQDDLTARLTQSVGPMTATFTGDVRIVERVPEKRIAFTAVGKSVRGASGNVRAEVEVSLEQVEQRTAVTVEADVTLAGPLGSVGQKVVAKQAGKVTAAFTRNLEHALGSSTEQASTPTGPAATASGAPTTGTRPTTRADRYAHRWAQTATLFAAAAFVVAAISLARDLRREARR